MTRTPASEAARYSRVGIWLLLVLALVVTEARAQQPSKIHQIGYVGYGTAAESANRVTALRMGLRDHGYVEGKNINLVFRWADTARQLPELAAELVRLHVDVLVAPSSTEVEAARSTTSVIPIVFATHADPVGVGHVASLARPGGNITGMSMLLTELVAKQLEFMKEALPRLRRIGVLAASTAPSTRPAMHAVESAAQRLGVQFLSVPVQEPEEFERAFAMMARERVDGFLAVASPLIRSHRAALAQLALKHHLAGMFGVKEHVEAGGLMCYSPDLEDTTRRAASYIDKILRGARPADLPVEQASRYQLFINLKTAEKLGIAIAPRVLQRADGILE